MIIMENINKINTERKITFPQVLYEFHEARLLDILACLIDHFSKRLFMRVQQEQIHKITNPYQGGIKYHQHVIIAIGFLNTSQLSISKGTSIKSF